ncbi:DUF6417 family protein [Streptomyces sp. CA-106131]|uniref:DUF6417 family protein n=1 Tax=Streptomyces sp. CA-106131 TaxID=3240045 RepID=UPI003D8FBF29
MTTSIRARISAQSAEALVQVQDLLSETLGDACGGLLARQRGVLGLGLGLGEGGGGSLAVKEAQDVLRLLVTVAQVGGPRSGEADRLAWEVDAPIPRRTDRSPVAPHKWAAPESRVRP